MGLSLYDVSRNASFGYSDLLFVNCSNFPSCLSCTSYATVCSWGTQSKSCTFHNETKALNEHQLINSNDCPSMYLHSASHSLAYNVDTTFTVHIEPCQPSVDVQSCQLSSRVEHFALIASNPTMIRSTVHNASCSLKCPFRWSTHNHSAPFEHQRPFDVELSIQFSNQTVTKVPQSKMNLYSCEGMSSNCTTCLQLDPSFACVWCHNRCQFNNSTVKCTNHRQCFTAVIQTIEPMLLPISGGTLVTIHGKYFDVTGLSIDIAGVPCQLIDEESSNEK